MEIVLSLPPVPEDLVNSYSNPGHTVPFDTHATIEVTLERLVLLCTCHMHTHRSRWGLFCACAVPSGKGQSSL